MSLFTPPGNYSRKRCYSTVKQDYYTKPITNRLLFQIKRLTGKTPYVIINNVHRQNADVNRDIKQGAASVPLAEKVWNEYHEAIQKSRQEITGPGLYLDIHGHSHSHGLVEIGYRVLPGDLNHRTFSACDTSIKHLACRVNVNTSLADLFWGEYSSLGAIFNKAGLQSIPSPEHPSPGQMKYYRGGYDTYHYGSQLGGEIDGIQIELPIWARNRENGTMAADALAQSLVDYMKLYYT